MNQTLLQPCTAFLDHRRISAGTLAEVAIAVKETSQTSGPVFIFDDRTGKIIDLDTRGMAEDMLTRLAERLGPESPTAAEPASSVRGRGRPKLGVVAREITLLPRHWEWLNAQPGGASVALRKLVDEARRSNGDRDRRRVAQESAYRFMSAIAGNLPNFEEASRALFAFDQRRFGDLIAEWPQDVRDYATKLAFANFEPAVEQQS